MIDATVRVDQAALQAALLRANTKLTPEGAESWYRNDIPMLVAEIKRLTAEHQNVMAALRSDMPATDTDFTDVQLVEVWKAEASGIYTKTQTKKLRDEANHLRYQITELRAAVRSGLGREVALQQAKAEVDDTLAQERAQMIEYRQAADSAVNERDAHINDLEHRLESVTRQLNQQQTISADREAMALAVVEQRIAEEKELLLQAASRL